MVTHIIYHAAKSGQATSNREIVGYYDSVDHARQSLKALADEHEGMIMGDSLFIKDNDVVIGCWEILPAALTPSLISGNGKNLSLNL